MLGAITGFKKKSQEYACGYSVARVESLLLEFLNNPSVGSPVLLTSVK